MLDYIKPLLKKCPDNLIIWADNWKATCMVNKTNKQLPVLQLDVIDNSNIGVNFLNKSGLHLDGTCMGRLSIKFIKKIKSFNRC